jgi:pimeloyl-ACP methyl ester carboxylesterase
LKYLALALLILASSYAFYQALQPPDKRYHWPLVQSVDEAGLRPVDCWFGDDDGLSPVECYDMQVPERHATPGSRYISFPVMVFRNRVNTQQRSPLLVLGAGGPGAPMYLDDHYSMEALVREMANASLTQGRDLVVIDPRGSGKAKPLLTCETFIEGEQRRFRQNLTLEQTRDSVEIDYRACIEAFLEQKVDHAAYNSFAVAQDIEALRRAAGIERWVLFGVSYAANYALTIANEFPDSVESMVLDSAYVSRVGYHETFIEQTTRPYRLLFNYCNYDPDCKEPIDNVKARFWRSWSRAPLPWRSNTPAITFS